MDFEGSVTNVNSRSVIAIAVAGVGSVFTPGNVSVGSKINAFFISQFQIGATGSTADGSLNWYIVQLHSGQGSPPNAGETGNSEIRNQIIHEEKGLAGSEDGTPMAFKGVIVIPRGMRRVREGDSWELVIRNSNVGQNTTFCTKAIYKEIR